jgi:hypothetical protein
MVKDISANSQLSVYPFGVAIQQLKDPTFTSEGTVYGVLLNSGDAKAIAAATRAWTKTPAARTIGCK